MFGWLKKRREAQALVRHAIPDELWRQTLQSYPFLAARSEAELIELRRLCSLFLADKEFHGAAGFEVTDEVALAVAAQACLPVLKLGLEWLDGFKGIVMHAGEVLAPREVTDDDGIVHAYDEELAGEAMEGGPLMLAWSAVQEAGAEHEAVFNVVIHEFAHVLDMRRGGSQNELLESVWGRWCRRIDRGMASCIDAYGMTSLEEFFAVASEAFFVAPEVLEKEQPALCRLLSDFYRQD
ncbi:zinc-dependent peptidase [Burkholderiaceae bacterium UC74_6]